MDNIAGLFLIRSIAGLTRIAYTENLPKRFSEWQKSSPWPLEVIATVTDTATVNAMRPLLQPLLTEEDCQRHSVWSPALIGALLKRKWADKQHRGDWYVLDHDDIRSLPFEGFLADVEITAGAERQAGTQTNHGDHAHSLTTKLTNSVLHLKTSVARWSPWRVQHRRMS